MRIIVIAVVLLCSAASGDAASSNPTFAQLASTMTGHWRCSSGSQTYTTDWTVLPNAQWIRGVNRSRTHGVTSLSEDMETYDALHRVWRIVDMEPNGSMSVLVGSGPAGHVSTQSVYPDASQRVRYDRVSNRRYTLTFDFLIKSKHSRWVDICSR
ncbi:MAG TPA: hypothetical protein VIN40_09565 [Candidatus Tyrphobacter sp.]